MQISASSSAYSSHSTSSSSHGDPSNSSTIVNIGSGAEPRAREHQPRRPSPPLIPYPAIIERKAKHNGLIAGVVNLLIAGVGLGILVSNKVNITGKSPSFFRELSSIVILLLCFFATGFLAAYFGTKLCSPRVPQD